MMKWFKFTEAFPPLRCIDNIHMQSDKIILRIKYERDNLDYLHFIGMVFSSYEENIISLSDIHGNQEDINIFEDEDKIGIRKLSFELLEYEWALIK